MRFREVGTRFTVIRFTRLNGARMPSMAEELATDWKTDHFRTAGSRRYGLVVESSEPMGEL